MAVYKQKGSKNWWYQFIWDGKRIRESTKQTVKRVAEQMEAAHKATLAKGEVGIREKKPIPSFKDFVESDFLPFVDSRFLNKPKTLEYYRNGVKSLLAFDPIASSPLDSITASQRDRFHQQAQKGQAEGKQHQPRTGGPAGECCDLLSSGVCWRSRGCESRCCPARTSATAFSRADEESRYLKATVAVGESILAAHASALDGIRAQLRGEIPEEPSDPFLLRDVTTILLDCGLRPEESFRLRWQHVQEDVLHIPFGKTENARRRIPLTQRAAALLSMRRGLRFRGLGVSRSDPHRPHREVQPAKAAPQGDDARQAGTVQSLHPAPHLPDPLGGIHGPVHSGVSGRAQRFFHHEAVCSPAGRHGAVCDGAGARSAG